MNKVNQKQTLSKKYASVLLNYAIKKNTAELFNVTLFDNKVKFIGGNNVQKTQPLILDDSVNGTDLYNASPFFKKTWVSQRWIKLATEICTQTKTSENLVITKLSRKVQKVPYLKKVFNWTEYKWKINTGDNKLVKQALIPNPILRPYNLVQELQFITFVIKHIPAFNDFINTPTISAGKKRDFLLDLTQQFSPITMGFLVLLSERNHLYLLPTIIEQYNELLNTFLGVKDITVVCSCVPTKSQYKLLKQKLEEHFIDTKKKKSSSLMLKLIYDSSLLGGVIVYDKSTKIDLSLKGKLNRLMQTI
jgi:F-type H+-transporting ATPase subunit delta